LRASLGRLLIYCCCTALLTACGGSGGPETGQTATTRASASETIPFAPTPDSDPFYAQPNPMPDAPLGTILESRAAKFAPLGVELPNEAWQLKYVSTDLHGNRQAAIATVVQPLTPVLTGRRPLLSYQFAVNSPGLKCAPSHQVTGSLANSNSQLEAREYLPIVLGLG